MTQRYYLLFLAAVLTTSAITFAQAPDRTEVETHRDIVYGKVGDLPLHVDVYLPKQRDAKTGLVVWIHGGGWQNGSKNRCPFTWLTAHNYAVASVQYRLTDKAIFPAQIHDCKGAIRFLRANAKKYGYNAKRIGVVGISAGGHLVALLGTSAGVKELEGNIGGNLVYSSRVQAVIDMCGPSDFMLWADSNKSDNPKSATHKLFGGAIRDKKSLAQLASPSTHVTKDDAPLRIVHGTKDPLVPIQHSKHLRDLYKKAELEVTLDIIEGGGHVPKQFLDQERREAAVKFYAKHLRKTAAK